MQQTQVSQRKAFQHVLEHHTLEFLMSDEELSQKMVSLIEEVDQPVRIEPVAEVPAPRVVVGLMYPPTKEWSKLESCLDYLRILAYMDERQYAIEAQSQVYQDMMLQIHEVFRPDLQLDEFAQEVDTQSNANKLLTFLTGEEHPLKPMSWEGMFWDIQPIGADNFLGIQQ